MDLGDKWEWRNRKLACRVAPETGNPAGDDLRARFAELAGKDLDEMNKIYDTLESMKNTKHKKEVEKKGVHIDHKADKKFKEVLTRKHILGATQLAMMTIDDEEHKQATTVTQKNLKKQFARLPVVPPARVLLEIQRERAKPPTVVESEDILAKRAKLEKKLEKQRIKRMAAMKATESDATKLEETSAGDKSLLMKTFKASENGDLFSTNGDYMSSMLYMSRMSGNLEKSNRMITAEKVRSAMEDAPLQKDDDKDDNSNDDKKKDADKDDGPADEGDDSQSQGSHMQGTDATAKLYCAASLCNWSRNSSNAARLAQEGGVRAIMQLLGEPSVKIRRFAAAAFRFMSEDPMLSVAMIEEGAVGTISDIVKVPIDEFSATNLAVALVNLTRINGREALLVEGSTVLCLHNIILNAPELSSLCARGLYNLTCVDGMYPLMERLIRTIITISSSKVGSVKHICAAALCNLSDLKLMRPRLIEEGVIAVLGTIARHAPTRTRRVCAVILQNLSATRSCRIEMVIRSSVHVAHGLSSDKDPIILRCVGLTLARLSTEPANSARIVQEYGVTALINIAMKFSAVPGISQPVSTALQLLSQQPSTRVAVVQEGCVTSIAQLLHTSKDTFTLQNALFSLSNLLTEPDNHLPIVQQGLILTIVNMAVSEHETIRDLCTLAFFNMSCASDSHKHIVNAGAIASLIQLSTVGSAITKQRCAAALCNVSAYESGISRMVGDGIIPALVKLLSEDDATIHYSCAALCRLCSTQENSEMISRSGGVQLLVEGTLKSDNITKQFCGAVLSALSFYDVCRAPLCDFGAIEALKSLASLNDDLSHQRCLVAFANISCEESVRERMVEEGVVAITASLIGNSYQEKNYICCAKALCNLACAEKTRLQVASQGGVHALLMVSMVHSVDRQTKLLCVLALYNLLDASTVTFMLDEGISTSVANLTKLGDERILNLCAKMLNYLTRFEPAMERLAERHSLTYSAICTLIDAEDPDTKLIGSRTLANLILSGNITVSNSLIEGGAFESLERGCQLDDISASKQCIAAIFSSCYRPEYLDMLGRTGAVKKLMAVADRGIHIDEQVYIHIAQITAMIANNESSRPSLRDPLVIQSLFQFIASNADRVKSVEVARWLARAVTYICNGYPDHSDFMGHGAIEALVQLHSHCDDTGVVSSAAAETVRLIVKGGNPGAFVFDLCSAHVMQILRRATEQAKANNDEYTLYNVAVTLFEVASANNRTRIELATEDVLKIMITLLDIKACDDLAIAIMFQLYNDSKARAVFSHPEVAHKLVAIMKRGCSADAFYNAISAFWALTKLPSSRDYLSTDVGLDIYILEVSRTENAKLKANCARLLKNLSSDANEAIEEGAVAALIAISLEGKAQRNKAGNEMRQPPVEAAHKTDVLDCQVSSFDGSQYVHHVFKETAIGGAAGKGPGLPEPPSMQDHDRDGRFSSDELDGNEVEGKAKMSFAKMQVPTEVKQQHLLGDADFDMKDDEHSMTEEGTAIPDSVVAGGKLENSVVLNENSVETREEADPASATSAAGAASEQASAEEKSGVSDASTTSVKGSKGKADASAADTGGSKKGHKGKKGAAASGKAGKPETNKPSSSPRKGKTSATGTGATDTNADLGSRAAEMGLYK